jgi:hypothetical protein
MTSKPKPGNPEQFKRFLKTAKEIGAGLPDDNFDRALKRIAETKRDPEQKKPKP